MIYCPTCGRKVDEAMEAHHVGKVGRGRDDSGAPQPLVWPSGQVVLRPCGHPLPVRVWRLLT